jgi:hypothetical protein
MSDEFQRLLQGKLDARVRNVLGSALGDAPSREGVRVAAQALGLSAAAAELARASVPAAGAAQGKLATQWLVFKWFSISVVVGSVTGSMLWLSKSGTWSEPGARPAPAPKAAVAQSTPEAIAAATKAPEASRTALAAGTPETKRMPATGVGSERQHAPPPTAAVEAKSARSETAEAKRAGNARTTPRRASGDLTSGPAGDTPVMAAPAPADALAEEIGLLDGARRALASGDSASALAALDRYDASPSKHVLESEALLLRVRALLRSERKSEACALARRHIDAHGADAYAEKLGRLCRGP